MQKIYYAIEREMEVPDEMTDEEIEELIEKIVLDNNVIWDHHPGVFYEDNMV